MSPSDSPPAELIQQRQALVRQLRRLEPFILRGSLIERFKRCGKAGCKCTQGPGHGPKYYLSVSQPGARPQMDYVPVEYFNRSPSTSTTFSKCVNCWSGFATSIASYYGAERSSEQTWSLQHLGWIWIWPGCSSPTFCKAGCKPA